MVYQIGGLITGEVAFNPFTVVAFIALLIVGYLLVRPDPNKSMKTTEIIMEFAIISLLGVCSRQFFVSSFIRVGSHK